jgi:hypothetical protein
MLTVTITNTIMSKTRNAGGGGGIPPSNTVAPVISGSSVIGSTLSSTTGTWVGDPVITYSYQWKRAGVDIVGETNSTYVLVAADYNQAITCEVTATNAFGAASATSNSITGTATAPVNTVAPVISGTAVVGQTLSSTTGTWTGTPTITYAYQWKRNGSNIASATSSTYTLVQADATFAITCAVTATNIAGSAEATSNSLTITDADAQAFFTASGLTGATNLTAINNLVVALKGFGIWTKMKAIYPIIGGTAALHKWNLKDPQDTNAAFRLVFSGGWTHSSTGALPNGTNGYADTFFNTDDTTSVGLQSYGVYLRTNPTFAVSTTETSTGLRNGIYWIRVINTLPTTSNIRSGNRNDSIAGVTGLIGNSRSTTTQWYVNNNSTIQAGSVTASALSPETVQTFSLGAYNDVGIISQFSTQQIAFAFYGEPLISTEMQNFYTAVQAFQTTLGRQV